MSLQEQRIKRYKEVNEQLVRLLQEANEREEKLRRSANHWHKAYDQLYQDYLALEFEDACQSCREQRASTPDGKTYTTCRECYEARRDWKKEVKALTEKVRYWEECYETLLEQHFGHDRGGHDDPHQRNGTIDPVLQRTNHGQCLVE